MTQSPFSSEDIEKLARALRRVAVDAKNAFTRLGEAMERISPLLTDALWRLTEYDVDAWTGNFQVSNPLVPGVIGFGITPGQAWADFVRQVEEEAVT